MKPPEIQTSYTEQWKTGMDTRQGVFQNVDEDAFSSFRELINCLITVNGGIKTRPPLLDVGGVFAANTQGLLYNKGAFFTFGERGSTVTNTGNVAAQVTTLYFDTPEDTKGFTGVYGAWTLLAQGVYQGFPYAVIRHERNSVLSQYVNVLHIWDARNNEPTFVFDPAVPTDWSIGTYPQWPYGTGTGIPGSRLDYTPVLEYAAEKLWMSRADGNLAFSGIGRARVWNSRSVTDIETNGVEYYTRAYVGTSFRICIPETRNDFVTNNTATSPTYAAYVCEKLNATTGAWTKLNDATGEYSLTLRSPAWAPTSSYTLVSAATGVTDGQLCRFRASIAPPTSSVSGCLVQPGGQIFTGDGSKYNFLTSIPWFSAQIVGGLASGYNVLVGGKAKDISTATQQRQYTLTNQSGVVGITFESYSVLITAGNPVANVQTNMAYSYATDVELPPVLFLNGVKQTAGFTYTNVGGKTNVNFAPPQNISGQTLTVALIPPAAAVISFDGTPIVVSSGQVLYEGAIIATPAILRSAITGLAASTGYYILAGVDAVTQTTAETIVVAQAAISGLQRYTHNIIGYFTTDSSSNLNVVTQFVYANILQNAWYTARHQLNISYFSGENEAAFINTAPHDNSGLPITTLVSVKNRMMICYARRTQLWQTAADLASLAYIDAYDFGTTDPTCVFFNRPVINTQRGVRGFDLTGLNFQSLEDTNIGESLQYIGTTSYSSVAFWPWLGCYVAFGVLNNPLEYANIAKLDADSPLRTASPLFGMFLLSFSKESQTLGWSFNIIPGLTSSDVKQLIPLNGKLYTRSGTHMYYLEAETTTYVDAPQNTPISSRAVTHYNHLKAPNRLKRLISLGAVCSGKLNVQAATTPWLAGAQVEVGPTLTNGTYGRSRIPFTATGVAVSLIVTADTAAGFDLQNLQVEYVQTGRS